MRIRSKESENKNTKKCRRTRNTPRNKSTTPRRPRPPRDGVRRNTSHGLAHTRTLPPYIPGLWKSASLVYIPTRTAAVPLVYVWCCSIFSPAQLISRRYRCDMYLRFRGCTVVRDIELSMSAWYQKTRRVLLSARRILLVLLLAAERGGVRCAA